MISDVQAAIEAAQLSTGDLANDDDSSTEEDEVVERYPGRVRQPPNRNGSEEAGASANASLLQQLPHPVLIRDLPLPPRTLDEARQHDDWPLWEAAVRD